MSEQYVLDMEHITKVFPGVRALDDVTFKVRPGTVHALMGENGAGKSTLMKCLFGIYTRDAGSVKINGEEVFFQNPKQALEHGVSMVQQELDQVPERNVMDNIWLGRFPKKGPFVDEAKMLEDTKAIFDELGVKIDPKAIVSHLSVSTRQLVEIAKAVSYNSKVLVLDEPTSSLTEREVELLFDIMNKLKAKGCGIVYISHRMEEILNISDEVTIMRDGKWVACKPASELTTDSIISYMVGRNLENRFPPKDNVPGEVVLEVKDIFSMYDPRVLGASFDLREGEVLGISGLVGARRTELVETIFGIRKRESGSVILKGEELKIKKPRDAIDKGFALVTEDRRLLGLFPLMDIQFNSTIANIRKYLGKIGLLKNQRLVDDTTWVIDSLNVKTPSQKTLIRALSGGNQQKVILGRWLVREPQILLLDEPTRGIDVGAKYEIYQLIIDLAKKGKSIVMVSSEMPELLGVADRILVMSNGRVAGIVDAKTTTQEEIMRLSAMYL